MSSDASNLSIAVFTALGTVVGYLGTEVASASMFNRQMWPARFYNTLHPAALVAMVFLMPMGGPIHKAAVETLDKLVSFGLWKGYCRGDMLGTAFYKNTGHEYVVRTAAGSGPKKEARNAFWITVLELIPWSPPDVPSVVTGDEAAEIRVQEVRAKRPLYVLKLSRAPPVGATNDVPVVNGDDGNIKLQHLFGIFASEIVTMSFGIATAIHWKSYFSIWYLVPLLLKLIALFSHVRRRPIDNPSQPPANDGHVLCEVVDFSKGFFLIEGPSELVLQFFRHYGHPVRYHRGLQGDRVREVISMLTVVAAIGVYPGGLIAFIFAPMVIQWLWLGYGLYCMLAMHMYRFGNGENVGTTEECVARALHRRQMVCFDDGSGNRVWAQLESWIVDSVAEGRNEVEVRVEKILAPPVANHC
jgi:hypothetical protein